MLGMTGMFLFESYREQEQRAVRISAVITICLLGLLSVIVWLPLARGPLAVVFLLLGVVGLLFCITGPQNRRALNGAQGYAVADVTRLDESESVFVRTRGLKEGSDEYRQFYAMHPDREEWDRKRRAKGLLGKLGSIDGGYQPNAAMVHAAFDMPHFLGQHARLDPKEALPGNSLSPEKASAMVKHYARHLGADMVGICRLNENWVYSRRGEIHYDNWDEWGDKIEDLPKYAVVILLEMDRDHVISAPHTPSVAESAHNYAKGAYLSTLLAHWFSYMGYRGVAEHTRNYDVILPPLAADAGLGEIGRQGYLIAPKYGARVRLFAILTDMPLEPDKPISLGVEEFCRKCLKCADACPSRSIPTGDKTVCRGVEKWKLDEDSCFDYWGRVGTDCSICMAICPFSRPDTPLHRVIRWFVAHSPLAKRIFPYIDNVLYGKKWRSRKVPSWLAYPKRSQVEEDYPVVFKDMNY